VILLHPEQAIAQPGVDVHRALRPASGAGCVDDVNKVVRPDSSIRILATLVLKCLPLVQEKYQGVTLRQIRLKRLLRQQNGSPGMVEDVAEARHWIARIHGKISAA